MWRSCVQNGLCKEAEKLVDLWRILSSYRLVVLGMVSLIVYSISLKTEAYKWTVLLACSLLVVATKHRPIICNLPLLTRHCWTFATVDFIHFTCPLFYFSTTFSLYKFRRLFWLWGPPFLTFVYLLFCLFSDKGTLVVYYLNPNCYIFFIFLKEIKSCPVHDNKKIQILCISY